jgi:hypothetical protein
VWQWLIKSSPCVNVKRLINNRKKIEILTLEEVRQLFPQDYSTVWGDKEIAHEVCACGINLSLIPVYLPFHGFRQGRVASRKMLPKKEYASN